MRTSEHPICVLAEDPSVSLDDNPKNGTLRQVFNGTEQDGNFHLILTSC
jgi:hypothetical protein